MAESAGISADSRPDARSCGRLLDPRSTGLDAGPSRLAIAEATRSNAGRANRDA